jgi:hypothetical protein
VDVKGRFPLRGVVPRNVDHCKGVVCCCKGYGLLMGSSKLVTLTIKKFEWFRKSQEPPKPAADQWSMGMICQ